MDNNRDNSNFDRSNRRSSENVDRTSRSNVDRTAPRGVDRTGGVDRTAPRGVDRTGGVDRTAPRGVDRTGGVDRTASRGVDRTGQNSSRQPVETDFFPELHIGTDEIELTSHSGKNEAAEQAFEPVENEYASSKDASDRPDVTDMFGTYGSNDLYSDSHRTGYLDSGSTGEIENLSSSAPHMDDYDYDELPEKEPSKLRRTLKRVGKVALTAFLVMVIVGCIVVSSFAVYVFGFVDDTMDYDLYDLTLNYTTTIYVEDQSYTPQSESDPETKWVEYQELYYENRTWVGINDMDQNVIDAFVAAEDERFYKHKGVDWKRTIGSFANLFLHFWETEQGGSTITQQLVKNLTSDNEKSAMRKIREIMRARNVESVYAKDTIIECYLNVIYLGNNCYGIEAAANYYFGKSASDLTVAEAATIAAIAKSPSGFDPITNPDSNKSRREWIIKNMHNIQSIYNGERGITEEERDAALAEEITIVGSHSKVEEDQEGEEKKTTGAYSWFTDALIEQVIEDLMAEQGISYEGAENKVYRGGLKIYATLDTDAQAVVDSVFIPDTYWAQVYGTEQKAQGAITVMDYEGHVVAIAGGRGEKTGKRDLNRAYSSPRQPGSSMKPIGVYAPALESNVITWSTMIENTSLTVGGIRYKNSGGYTSSQETIQRAIQKSYNLVAARVYLKYNDPNKLFNFVTNNFGITTLVESTVIDGKTYSDIGLSQLALGSSTYGLTTVEEAAAYATFGNGGLYYEPTFYTVIKDQSNKTVLEYDSEPTQAISAETSYIMNKMMQTVVSGGTGASAAFGGWEIFGKTGTTDDNKDRWFAGGTPYYVASCWFGCDIPFNMANMSTSGNPALNLWKPIMQGLHENLAKKSFPTCSTVKYARYCVVSGGLATDKCTEGVEWGYYKKDYAPVCTEHKGGSVLGGTDPDPTPTTSSAAPESSTQTSSEPTSSTVPESSSSQATSSSETSSAAAEAEDQLD